MQGLSIERLHALAELLVDPATDAWVAEERWIPILSGNYKLPENEVSQVCRFVRECMQIDPDVRLELTPERAPELAPGSVVDRYTILERIGAGGMGAVYKARFQAMDMEPRMVALKVGHGHLKFIRRLRAERNILSRFDHPNIIQILDAGTTPSGLPYFVSEFVDGALKITQFCKSKPLVEQLRLFTKLCTVVDSLHQRNIAHRDLKPSNVLVSVNGDLKLLDFGLAGFIDSVEDTPSFVNSARTPRQLGTDGRMSPQQAAGEAPTRSDDIFSLGTILRDLLKTSSDAMDTDAHAKCAEVRDKCLLSDANLRFRSAEEVAQAINQVLHRRSISVGKSLRSKPLLFSAVGVCLLAAIGSIAWQQSRNRERVREDEANVREHERRDRAEMETRLAVSSPGLDRITGMNSISDTFESKERRALQLIAKGDVEAALLLARFYVRCRTQAVSEDRLLKAKFKTKNIDPLRVMTGRSDEGFAYRAVVNILTKHCSEDKVQKAYRLWELAADRGSAKAATYLAWLWHKGEGGVDPNPTQALKRARQAAAANDKGGLYLLGLIYLEGKALVQDKKAAYKNFEKAAWRGSVEGELQMARLYERGETTGGVPNLIDALAWATAANSQGVGEELGEDDPFLNLKNAKKEAAELRQQLEKVMSAQDVASAHSKAREIEHRIAAAVSDGH